MSLGALVYGAAPFGAGESVGVGPGVGGDSPSGGSASSDVDLAPLRNSHEATQLEAELKLLFIHLFNQYVRPQERETNTAGTPHLGPFVQVERAVKSEGLSLFRKADDGAMRYLFRSWRARNPKRGLHMLQAYLQLLWPNAITMTQMWAPKTGTYPLALVEADGGNHFLTSRVNVKVSSGSSDGSDIDKIGSSLRSVLPARIMLNIALNQAAESEISLASGAHGSVVQYFEGNLV
jgi:hypothetical protein